MSAASVPKAASEAVPQSTQAAARAQRLVRRAREVGGAAHHLADAVEAVLVAPRAARAEGRDRGEDDVGLDRPQAVEIERERAQHLGRQVGHDDVGGGDELLDDLAPLGAGGVEAHRALVPVHDEEHGADPVGTDGRHPAILAPAAPLDADHVRAEVGEQRRAVRPGDIAPEVEHPKSRENAFHRLVAHCVTSRAWSP